MLSHSDKKRVLEARTIPVHAGIPVDAQCVLCDTLSRGIRHELAHYTIAVLEEFCQGFEDLEADGLLVRKTLALKFAKSLTPAG
jgi:hypothetical protein